MTLQELLEKALEQIKTVGKPKEVPVIKSVEQEERKALFVVLEPDVVDLHSDTYTAKEVEKACLSFNKFCGVANLMHEYETKDAEITQSYIAPATFELEGVDGIQTVQKGTWVQEWFFPDTEKGNELWEGVKDGTYNGISIGARGHAEKLD
jgi:hypothetical protein